MEDKEQESYKVLVKDMEPLSYKDVAEDWEKNSDQWFHALVAIVDLPIILAIPDLKIYAWCRCKVVADDASEAHFHWHGLVHFPNRKMQSWKMQCRRAGVKFASTKNTFKKVICLDHAVGVLRYMACKDGQRVGRRDVMEMDLLHIRTHITQDNLSILVIVMKGVRNAPMFERRYRQISLISLIWMRNQIGQM